jgi:hypothetical protein
VPGGASGLRLTADGEKLLGQARRILVLHDEVLESFSEEEAESVAIGSTEHAAAQLLPKVDHRAVTGLLFLEDVLDLVAGLLEVTLGLVDLAFSFQFFVVGGPAYAFLDLALDFRGLMGRLVFSRHSLARSFHSSG